MMACYLTIVIDSTPHTSEIKYNVPISLWLVENNHLFNSYGWLLRTLHANGASIFFVCIYLHVGRGIYYGSYKFFYTWSVGVLILFITIATSFIGYVLPWGIST